MPNIQKRTITGSTTVKGDKPARAIVLPLLPMDGSWSVTGHVIAVDEGAPRASVTYCPHLTGTLTEGAVAQNNTPKIASQPRDGGREQAWAPGGINVVISDRRVEIEVAGIEGKAITWAWSLDVVTVSLR